MRLLASLVALVMLSAAPACAQAPLALEGSAAPLAVAALSRLEQDALGQLQHARQSQGDAAARAARSSIKEVTGDPAKGQQLAFDRNRGGGCLACHVMGPKTLETPGNVGPDLSEIGNAGRTDQWLFNYVFDARRLQSEIGDAAVGQARLLHARPRSRTSSRS